jgi:hypothetical protein
MGMAVPAKSELSEASITGVPSGVTADDVTDAVCAGRHELGCQAPRTTTQSADRDRDAGQSLAYADDTTLRRVRFGQARQAHDAPPALSQPARLGTATDPFCSRRTTGQARPPSALLATGSLAKPPGRGLAFGRPYARARRDRQAMKAVAGGVAHA